MNLSAAVHRRPSTSDLCSHRDAGPVVTAPRLREARGAGSAQLTPGLAQRPTCRLFRSSKPWARRGTRPERLRPADDDDRLQGPHAGPRPRSSRPFSAHTSGMSGPRAEVPLREDTHSGNTTERHRGRRIKNLKGQAPKLPTPTPALAMFLLGGGTACYFP